MTSKSFSFSGFIPTGFEQADFISFVVPHEIEQQFQPSAWKMGYAGVDGRITENFLHQLVRLVVVKRKQLASNGSSPVVVMNQMTAEIMADAAGWKGMFEYILEEVNRAIVSLPTTLEEDEDALDNLKFEYNEWVKLTARVRFKRVLRTVKSNLEHRLAADTNSEASWETPMQRWSIVHQMDTVNARRSKALKRESLFEITLHPDVQAIAEATSKRT